MTGEKNTNDKQLGNIRRRKDPYAEKLTSKIWFEKPSEDNPYIASELYCHGYNHEQLVGNFSFSDTIFLTLKGELPEQAQSELFGALLTSFITPGPRHPGPRSALLAAVSKGEADLLLPLSLSILAGEREGSAEVRPSMRFILKNASKEPGQLAKSLAKELKNDDSQQVMMPGFGSNFGGRETRLDTLADRLSTFEAADRYTSWASSFSAELRSYDMGWRGVGLFSAVLLDLGFNAKTGGLVYQLCNAVGLASHALENTGKPLTSVPFLDDDAYTISTRES